MLLNYIILLLLYWPCIKGATQDYVIDQVATAAENIATSLIENVATKTDPNSLTSSADQDHYTVHSQPKNSNGSIPIATSTPIYHVATPTTPKPQQGNSENALYSSEARIFLNLPNPVSNRRSFDTNDGQKEFEILKVNDQIPAVANYHEFYENLKSNMQNNEQPGIESPRNLPYHRSGERMKQIGTYLNYNINHERGNIKPYQDYYNHENTQEIQKKNVHEREKVHNNYQQQEASNYDIFDESVPRQKATSALSTNYDSNADTVRNNRNKLILLAKQRESKPLMVVQPGEYKVNLHYGNQQGTAKSIVSTTESYYSPSNIPEERYDKDDDYPEESNEYYEITERPRKLHKSRRKPSYSESSRKLPKEHRGSSTSDSDELKKVNSFTRGKSHRSKTKSNNWADGNQGSDGSENSDEKNRGQLQESGTDGRQPLAIESPNSWNQIAPNVEFSQSNGYEISQIDKPNVLVPINLNLLPLSNFDHSSALENSQGFDFTNAGISSFVTGGTMVSTAAPLVSSSQPILMTNISPQSATKTGHASDNGSFGYSTSVPDVIVGQNSYQNQVQAVLVPHSLSNKYIPNLKTYYPSTAAPIITVNQGKLNAPHVTTIPQLFYSSSTMQPIIQTPTGQSSNNYNILINPNGLHGQNMQTSHQTSNSNNDNSKINNSNSNAQLLKAVGKQSKHTTFTAPNDHFLTSASFSVGQGTQSSNDNNYYIPTNNANNNYHSGNQLNSNSVKSQLQTNAYPKIKTFIPAQVIPAFVQTSPGITGINVVDQNQNQQRQHQIVNVGNHILENTWTQLRENHPKDYPNRVEYQNIYVNKDSIGSTSNNNANTVNAIQTGTMTKAQLPVVGVQTVEIQNPNIYIKPSPVDVSGINHYPAAVLTTPVSILSTVQSFLTPRPTGINTTPQSINIQNYVDSLTQIGAHNNGDNLGEHRVTDQNQFYTDRPLYNPMNFVPSVEVVKSQTLLNGEISEQVLPPQLNLVPVVPGGKFYKHSHAAQTDLISKPKLSSDLEKYAEEMFRESIRTIYNTHKWNLDKRIKNHTNDAVDFERLKNDLERYRAAINAVKHNTDLLEAHQSQPQVHSVDPGRVKRPGLSVATLEELFKNDFKLNSPSESQLSSNNKLNSQKPTTINDYLTPPRFNSFVSKSPFHDSNKSGKKRPSKTRNHSRPSKSHGSRLTNLETSPSHHVSFIHRRPLHNRNVHNEHRKPKSLDNYPTFTTSKPDISSIQIASSDYIDINHPRMHNYLGLLMKNKQLPAGSATSVVREEDDYKHYFDDVNRRIQMSAKEIIQSASPPHLPLYQ